MNKRPHIIWHNMGGHNLVAGMGSNFDLYDIFNPQLSPELLHWKWTRVSAGQLYHNITIASMLTIQASLIISSTRHWKRQENWLVKCERVTVKASLITPVLSKGWSH